VLTALAPDAAAGDAPLALAPASTSAAFVVSESLLSSLEKLRGAVGAAAAAGVLVLAPLVLAELSSRRMIPSAPPSGMWGSSSSISGDTHGERGVEWVASAKKKGEGGIILFSVNNSKISLFGLSAYVAQRRMLAPIESRFLKEVREQTVEQHRLKPLISRNSPFSSALHFRLTLQSNSSQTGHTELVMNSSTSSVL
jgi:hypothetical protein